MKVSSKTDYALRTVLDLARVGAGRIVPVSDIAERQQIPRKFLEQILSMLRSGDIVHSRRGARGGYCLARPASEIRLLDIIMLMDHALFRQSYDRVTPEGGRQDPFAEVWGEIDTFISAKLGATTVQDMLRRARVLEGKLSENYMI